MLSDSLGQEWISYLMNEFLYKQINSILKASLQTGIEWKRLLWGHMSALPCTMYLMTSISWVKSNFLGPRISRNDFDFSFHTITSVQCVSHTKSQSSTLWDFLSLFAPSKVIGTKEIPLHTQTMALYGHESQQFTALILSTLFLSTLIGFSKLCHPVLSLWEWSLRLPALSFKDPLLPLFSVFILSLRSRFSSHLAASLLTRAASHASVLCAPAMWECHCYEVDCQTDSVNHSLQASKWGDSTSINTGLLMTHKTSPEKNCVCVYCKDKLTSRSHTHRMIKLQANQQKTNVNLSAPEDSLCLSQDIVGHKYRIIQPNLLTESHSDTPSAKKTSVCVWICWSLDSNQNHTHTQIRRLLPKQTHYTEI